MGVISSNNQTDNWQAQDRHFRQLYAATTHDDFLKASAAAAAVVGGGATTTLEAGKSVKGGKGSKRAGSTLVSPLVLQPHLGLMDVLENHACFTYQVIWDIPSMYHFLLYLVHRMSVVTMVAADPAWSAARRNTGLPL